jgi:hypothetical protein
VNCDELVPIEDGEDELTQVLMGNDKSLKIIIVEIEILNEFLKTTAHSHNFFLCSAGNDNSRTIRNWI